MPAARRRKKQAKLEHWQKKNSSSKRADTILQHQQCTHKLQTAKERYRLQFQQMANTFLLKEPFQAAIILQRPINHYYEPVHVKLITLKNITTL